MVEIGSTGATAQALVNIPEAEKIIITNITDSFASLTVKDEKIAKRHDRPNPLDCVLHGEHGLAFHVETVVNGQSHAFLFDFGVNVQGVMRNMELLEIDFSKLDALAISHHHSDHGAVALKEILQAKRGEIPKGIPLYVGEQFFAGAYEKKSNGSMIDLLMLNKDALESVGVIKIVEISTPTPIVTGAYSDGGHVPQVTEYEKIPPHLMTKQDGQFVHDEFIGEQTIIMNVKGKGLVVLSGCAHRGIVNIVKHAQQITGIQKVYAIIGGFHLATASPEKIQKTIADIKAIDPDYIIPLHCTGFGVTAAFAREMPEQFILNTVGTKYRLE